jgi:hypothetical protein
MAQRKSKPKYNKPRFCKIRKRSFDSELEIQFFDLFIEHGLPPPETQVRPHPTIQWRFDFAWPNKMLAIEVQGYGRGHTSYVSMLKDYAKHNYSVSEGWTLLYLMSENLQPTLVHHTILLLRKMLNVEDRGSLQHKNLNPVIERRRIEAENANIRSHRRNI